MQFRGDHSRLSDYIHFILAVSLSKSNTCYQDDVIVCRSLPLTLMTFLSALSTLVIIVIALIDKQRKKSHKKVSWQ